MYPTLHRTITVPIRLLSLDGAHFGSFELAQILLLKSILYAVKSQDATKGDEGCDDSQDAMISEHFQFVAGTGFGGVIAMLATKISINKIADFYRKLHDALLTTPEWKEFDREGSAATLNRLVGELLPEIDLDEQILRNDSDCQCYTLTCAVNPENTAHPRLFTSYEHGILDTPCTLRQAIELSLADEEHLPPYKLGSTGLRERFVGAAHRYSNPLVTALKEAEAVFGPSQRVNCIVSVGAGTKGVITTDALKEMIIDSERQAEEWGARCSQVPGLFRRYNVSKGLADGNDLGAIRTHTQAYLDEFNTVAGLKALATRERSDFVDIGKLVHPVTDHDKNLMHLMRHIIPPRPPYLFGREKETGKIVASLLHGEPSVICGPGGVGKTCLGLTILYDEKIRDTTRYFIDCRDAPTLDFLYGKIARILGIKLGKDASSEDLWTAICNELESESGRCVVCLDNFETLWDQGELHGDIEDMLASLASLSKISLLVTMRGAKPPGQVNWATLISLSPLSRQDAFRLFQTHSHCKDDDQYAWNLVNATDFLPLAVELLGSLADGLVETTQDVWDRWEMKGTSVATRGLGARLDLNCSIKLSLNSPQLKKLPTAHSTLFLLSLLPLGLDTRSSFFIPLQNGIKDLLENLRCLTRQALVIIDNPTTRRYRLLSPIARYAADNLSSSFVSDDEACLIQSSIKFITVHDPYTPETHDFVPSELSNVYSVLAYASRQQMDDILGEGILGYARWAYYIGLLGDNLLHTIYNSKYCSVQVLAEAWRMQGDQYRIQHHLDEAEESLNKAILVFQRACNVVGEGNSRDSLGDVYMRQDRLDDAEESLNKAILLHQQAQNVLGEGNSCQSLGKLYRRQDRLEDAEESLNKAISLFQQAHDVLGEGNSRVSLGQLYMRQDRLDDAEESLNNAIALHQQAQNVLGEGNSRQSLGDLYMRQNRLDEAEESLNKAIPFFQQAQNVVGEGNSQNSLGDLYMLQDRLDEAEESLNKAIPLHQQAQTALGEGNSRQSLGQLYMRQDRLDEAEESLNKAIPLFQQAHHVLGEGHSHHSLGDLYMRQDHLDEAEESLNKAIPLFQQAQNVVGEGNSHQSLGQLYMRQDRLDEAEESLNKAIPLHQQAQNVLGEGNSRQLLGDLYMHQNRLDEAEESLNKAIPFFQQAQNVVGEGNSRNSLGDLYMRQDRLDEAEESLNKAIPLFQQAHHVLGEGNSRQSLGNLYMRQDRVNEAEESLNKAIPLHQQAQTALGEGNSRNSLGDLYMLQDHLDEAEESLNKAIPLFQQAHDFLGEGNLRNSLGQLYMRQDRLDEAEESLNKAIPLFQQAHAVLGEGNSRQSLGKLYFLRNDFSNAQASLNHSIHLFQKCQSPYSEAYSRKLLGIVLTATHELYDAEAQYVRAIDLHHQSSDESGAQRTASLLKQLRDKRSDIQTRSGEGPRSTPPPEASTPHSANPNWSIMARIWDNILSIWALAAE